jgi:hypothetical protein
MLREPQHDTMTWYERTQIVLMDHCSFLVLQYDSPMPSTIKQSEGVSDAVHTKSMSLQGTSAYEEARHACEEYIQRVLPTGVFSQKDIDQQRQWIESIEGDEKAIEEAKRSYRGSRAEEKIREIWDFHDKQLVEPLDDALRGGVISKQSYEEWLAWAHDLNRESNAKKYSIRNVLPEYLKERRKMAEERSKLREEKNIGGVTDPKLTHMMATLNDDKTYFGKLSFSERKSLIDGIRAERAVSEGGEEYRKLRNKAEDILKKATEEPQPALHRDKVNAWLKRIFESKASAKDINAFLAGTDKQSLQGLIQTWREIAVHFWYARKDPAFNGVKSEFINTKAFLWLNYKDRVRYVKSMHERAAEAHALRSEASSRIQSAKFALDAGGPDRWLNQYVFNGNHTLADLRSIIRGNMTYQLNEKVSIFDRYTRAMGRAKKYDGIRGMSFPPRAEFLGTKYPQQKSYVVEMELRLDQLEKDRPKFLTIRNAMDREDWDDALDLISDEEKNVLSGDDRKQLLSMRDYIKEHRKYSDASQKGIEKKQSETKEVDQLINSLPQDLQDMVIHLSQTDARCVRMFGWGMYNRDWCRRNGYLDPWREQWALQTGKQQALQKERQRKKKGVVSETIEGETGEEEFIELSRTSATNVCLDISDAGARNAMMRTVMNRRSDDRTWYWTNIIMHRGGTLVSNEQQKGDTKKLYKIGRLLRTLESKGEHYQYRGSSVSLAQKMKPATRSQGAHLAIGA